MKWFRHQLAKPMTIMYMMRFRVKSGAATFLPMVAIATELRRLRQVAARANIAQEDEDE